MTPRFRVAPTPGTEGDAGAWRSLSLVAEDGPRATPLIVASFILPEELAEEFTRQMGLLNDVLDLEEPRA
jgi:hypothetical protein